MRVELAEAIRQSLCQAVAIQKERGDYDFGATPLALFQQSCSGHPGWGVIAARGVHRSRRMTRTEEDQYTGRAK